MKIGYHHCAVTKWKCHACRLVLLACHVVLSCWPVGQFNFFGWEGGGEGGGERLIFKMFLGSGLINRGQVSSIPYLYKCHFLTPLFGP